MAWNKKKQADDVQHQRYTRTTLLVLYWLCCLSRRF